MFDAKSLLEALMKSGQPQAAQSNYAAGGGGLGDILGQILGGAQQGGAAAGGQGGGGLGDILGKVLAGAQGGGQGGSLGDILGKLGQQAGQSGGLGDMLGKALGQGQARTASVQPAPQAAPQSGGGSLGDMIAKSLGQGRAAAAPQADAAADQAQDDQDDTADDQQNAAGQSPSQMPVPGGRGASAAPSADADGGLGDLLRKLQAQVGGAGGAAGAGGLGDILGQIFGQATAGVSDGARRLDQATGASGRVRDATGVSPDEALEQLKGWLQQNQGAAMASAGGLGAILLGTHAGRALAGKAFKLGSLALIGGLAYKALQNYQAGRPLVTGAGEVAEAPRGSGYETAAVTHESAMLYIKAMIAAAAADGRLDQVEQDRITASLKQAGMGDGAEDFLANELNNPATPEQLAAACRTDQERVQVYTAARVALDVDDNENHAFLVALAAALGLDAKLTQHIDAAARGQA